MSVWGESVISRQLRELWRIQQIRRCADMLLGRREEPEDLVFPRKLVEKVPTETIVIGKEPKHAIPPGKVKIRVKGPEPDAFDEATGVSHQELEMSEEDYLAAGGQIGPTKKMLEWEFPGKKEGDVAWGRYQDWLAKVLEDPKRPVIPITFMYHRLATLVISIQERGSGKYYDFSTKLFAKAPLIPRAAFTQLGTAGKFSFLYGATVGRSGKLHGQYVVTVRDTDNKGTIVALLAYAIDNNEISTDLGATGLENYEAEKDLPPVSVGVTATTRSGRAVELD